MATPMMTEEKIAIVCSGGGMRCAYSAGALCALAQELKLTEPDIIIASSGSASGAMYYLAGQYDYMKDVWTKLISTPRFISLWRFWRIMNVDYLIDEVLKKQRPLDTALLRRVPTRYYIALTDVSANSVRYITNTDAFDLFEVLRAAKAIPVLYRKYVTLGGRQYIDGAVIAVFADTIKKAFALGATKAIAIDSRTAWKRKLFPMKTTSADQNIIFIKNDTMPAHLISRSAQTLKATFDMGYRDVSQNEELKAVLSMYRIRS